MPREKITEASDPDDGMFASFRPARPQDIVAGAKLYAGPWWDRDDRQNIIRPGQPSQFEPVEIKQYDGSRTASALEDWEGGADDPTTYPIGRLYVYDPPPQPDREGGRRRRRRRTRAQKRTRTRRTRRV